MHRALPLTCTSFLRDPPPFFFLFSFFPPFELLTLSLSLSLCLSRAGSLVHSWPMRSDKKKRDRGPRVPGDDKTWPSPDHSWYVGDSVWNVVWNRWKKSIRTRVAFDKPLAAKNTEAVPDSIDFCLQFADVDLFVQVLLFYYENIYVLE